MLCTIEGVEIHNFRKNDKKTCIFQKKIVVLRPPPPLNGGPLRKYVRRACSLRDITRWMSEQLVKDYSTKNNHDQFVRAWKDLGRYTPEVKDYVESLKENGVLPLNGIY